MTESRSAQSTGSLNVEIWNGPSKVVGGYGLTTEQAVEEVCLYLPVAPRAERDRYREALEWIVNHRGANVVDIASRALDQKQADK